MGLITVRRDRAAHKSGVTVPAQHLGGNGIKDSCARNIFLKFKHKWIETYRGQPPECSLYS